MRWIETHLGVRGFLDWEHLAVRRMAGTGHRDAPGAANAFFRPGRVSSANIGQRSANPRAMQPLRRERIKIRKAFHKSIL
jgi:hypothetical protein